MGCITVVNLYHVFFTVIVELWHLKSCLSMDGQRDKVHNSLYCNYFVAFDYAYVGLGKKSQGISTALAVEKTSRRGGKIVNASAEIGEYCSNIKNISVLNSFGFCVSFIAPTMILHNLLCTYVTSYVKMHCS